MEPITINPSKSPLIPEARAAQPSNDWFLSSIIILHPKKSLLNPPKSVHVLVHKIGYSSKPRILCTNGDGMALTDSYLRSVLGKEHEKVFEKTDRDGLSIRVSKKGKIVFQMRYMFAGK